MKPASQLQAQGFSRAELCLVLAVVALLAVPLCSSLARSREPGQRISCVNNLRQLGMALLVYSSENDGQFPPRAAPYWMTRLQRYYVDLRLLRCPADPTAEHTPAPGNPGDAANPQYAPRSYLINGWNDYFVWIQPGGPLYPMGMPENAIPEPAATIAFGEKVSDSAHIHMDLFQGFGDDITQVEHSRHFRSNPSDPLSGGSNYTMADGSVRFLKGGAELAPTNLWAVVPAWRTNNMATP